MLSIIIAILVALGIIQSTDDFQQLSPSQQQEYVDEYTDDAQEVIIDVVNGMEDGN